MMKKVNREEAERLAEEFMMAFGKELGENRADFCEALMDPDREDPPMFVEDDAWNNEVMDFAAWKKAQEEKVETTHRGSKKNLRRALILVAVLILVMGLAMVAAEGVKLKKSTMTMQETPGESTFLIDEEQALYNIEDFRVTYVPEGYEMVEDVVVGEYVRRIQYQGNRTKGIKIHITKTALYGANVDNESTGREEVLVSDKQAYAFYDAETGFVIWQVGDCTLDVTADLTSEELISIARQIYID